MSTGETGAWSEQRRIHAVNIKMVRVLRSADDAPYVAFASAADNLVARHKRPGGRIFARPNYCTTERSASTVRLQATGGTRHRPVIAPMDDTCVRVQRHQPVAGDTQVIQISRARTALERRAREPDRPKSSDDLPGPSISADGRYVRLNLRGNLVAGDTMPSTPSAWRQDRDTTS